MLFLEVTVVIIGLSVVKENKIVADSNTVNYFVKCNNSCNMVHFLNRLILSDFMQSNIEYS